MSNGEVTPRSAGPAPGKKRLLVGGGGLAVSVAILVLISALTLKAGSDWSETKFWTVTGTALIGLGIVPQALREADNVGTAVRDFLLVVSVALAVWGTAMVLIGAFQSA